MLKEHRGGHQLARGNQKGQKGTWRRTLEVDMKFGYSWGELERKAKDGDGWCTLVEVLCVAKH